MRKYRLAAMSFLLLLCIAPALMAQSTPAAAATKEESVRKLLNLTDAKGTFKRAIEAQLNMMKGNVPSIPPKFWDEVLKEVDPDKFMELIIPVYDKLFTKDEIEGMIAFYETPLGKKLVATLPQIITESSAAGDKYGQEVATKVIKRMQAEGSFPSAAPTGDGKPLPPRR